MAQQGRFQIPRVLRHAEDAFGAGLGSQCAGKKPVACFRGCVVLLLIRKGFREV